MVCWRPEWLPALADIQDPTDMGRYGMLPGSDSPHCLIDNIDPLGKTFDPRVDKFGIPTQEVSYLLEDGAGIAAWRHPEAMLRDHPRLWGPVGAWRSGVAHVLSLEAYRTASGFWVQCWAVMRRAHAREQIREDLRNRRDQDG